MKTVLALVVICAMATSVMAFDLGNQAPAKPLGHATPPPVDSEVLRQGGDTIADAVPLPIPAIDVVGTNVGYHDDYYEICPYTWSDSPDVVYAIAPETDMSLDVDLCGSWYDTHVFVYDEDLDFVACNDDFYGGPPCGEYVSKIENMAVTGGVGYYVIIDGYGGDSGEYLLNITEYVPCVLDCPGSAALEDEPPLVNDYVDLHNGGCNTDLLAPPFQPLTGPTFCGVSGFYRVGGSDMRDTDWFTMVIPSSGVIEVRGDAEEACYMFELGPQDCDSVGVLQNVIIGPCQWNLMTITGEPGSTVWFWVGPTTFSSPDGSDVYMFDYVLDTSVTINIESHSWTDVKALFD